MRLIIMRLPEYALFECGRLYASVHMQGNNSPAHRYSIHFMQMHQ